MLLERNNMKYILEYLEYLNYIKMHSMHTINNYKIDLIQFKEFNGDNLINIDKNCVNKYMYYLYDLGVSKKTIARKLSSLRNFYNFLYKKNIVDKNYFINIKYFSFIWMFSI